MQRSVVPRVLNRSNGFETAGSENDEGEQVEGVANKKGELLNSFQRPRAAARMEQGSRV